MLTKKQNYCQNNFKDQLWSEVSVSCEEEGYCYSFAERRLFYVLFGVTIFLGVIYFSGFTNEVASIFKSTRELDKLNDLKIQTMQSRSVEVSPTAFESQ